MLDLESFTYLSRALEQDIAPVVILASNRGKVPIRSSSVGSSTSTADASVSDPETLYAHGIPPDLLSRLLIIPTRPYSPPEIRTIIEIRARTERVNLTETALQRVTKKGEEVSLRYALQLLAPAQVLAKVAKRGDALTANGDVGANVAGPKIEAQDVEECEGLFLDARRSADALGGAEIGGRNGFIT